MSTACPVMRVTAPAKLTLSLRVTGVRADGYHLIDAEMVSLDLADTLEFGPGSGVTVVDEVVGGLGTEGVPAGHANLVVRALAALHREAAVRVHKRIPAGAGLGGGSADAAAVLRWAGCDDRNLAMQLGSDVPFCLRGGRARVTGVGERVQELPFEARRFVLLCPPLAVDTGAAYRAWDARRAAGAPLVPSDEGAAASVDGTAPSDVGNDLEAAALDVAPSLGRWRHALAAVTGRRPRLAGSGATWFVEGVPGELGLGALDHLVVDGEVGALVAVRTVPEAWDDEEAAGARRPPIGDADP